MIFFSRAYSYGKLRRIENDYVALTDRHKQLIPQFKKKLSDVKMCIEHNHQVIKLILSHANCIFENRDAVDDRVSYYSSVSTRCTFGLSVHQRFCVRVSLRA